MDDLKLIKKYYGEKMSHLCRELFPTVLETPGVLYTVLSKKFYPNKFLYDDIIKYYVVDDFQNLIYDELNISNNKEENEEELNKKIETPQELLSKAGYDLYECNTEEDIQKFKTYFARDEELCTFRGGRLENCYVFFAVKKNVEEIKREDFRGKEKRQDEYGTSVISIQFSRGTNNVLSIKNRYNHTVSNPDATFSNNLENIIPGLTKSFEEYYDLSIECFDEDFYIPGYTMACEPESNDSKYFKYNIETNNEYYCPNNVIIENFTAIKYDPSRYIVFEDFILDMQKKEISQHSTNDSFTDGLKNIESINVINKDNHTKEIIINNDIVITLNNKNQIIKYKNHHITEIKDNFLKENKKLEELDIPNVEEIGCDFLTRNIELKKLELPKCKKINSGCLEDNQKINKVYLPEVTYIAGGFMSHNIELTEISLPKAKEIYDNFLFNNRIINKVKLPKVKKLGYNVLKKNTALKRINLPSLVEVGGSFLESNTDLEELYAPKLQFIGPCFLLYNIRLEELELPNAHNIENDFLYYNRILSRLRLPKAKIIGMNFLYSNIYLQEIKLPKAEIIKPYFMASNCIGLKRLSAPKLKFIKEYFLENNKSLTELSLPSVEHIGKGILKNNRVLRKVEVPSLKTIKDIDFFIKYIYLDMKNKLSKLTNNPIIKVRTR